MDGLEIQEIPSSGKSRESSARPNAHLITHIRKARKLEGGIRQIVAQKQWNEQAHIIYGVTQE